LFLSTDKTGAVSVEAKPDGLYLWAFGSGSRLPEVSYELLRATARLTP